MEDMTSQERLKYGGTRVFSTECDLKAQDKKGPVIVCMEGENIELSEDEVKLLSLGPKFSVLKNLEDEKFEASLEESLMKYKWDCMSEKYETKPELSDIALNTLLKELCTEEEYKLIEDEVEMDSMRLRMVYDSVVGRFNYSKKKVTDTKGNSRVNFPKEGGEFDDEAKL